MQQIRGKQNLLFNSLFLQAFLHFSGLLSVIPAQATNSGPAWEVRNEWNEGSEIAFAEFIQQRWSNTYLNTRESPYTGLRIESSDQAVIARAIFAYERSLPFRVRLTSGQIIDQSLTTSGADRRTRLRNFLNFVADGFNSDAIAHNTFPVKVATESLEPGVIFVTDSQDSRGESGPAVYLLHQLGPRGHLRFSSVRSTFSTDQRRIFIRWFFPNSIPLNVLPNNRMGFRRFFQPQDYSLTPRERALSQAQRGRSDTDQVNINLLAFARAREANPELARSLTQIWTNRGVTNHWQLVTTFWRTIQAKLSEDIEESESEFSERSLEIACDYLRERAHSISDIAQALRRQTNIEDTGPQGITLTRCTPLIDNFQVIINDRERELNIALEPLKNWLRERTAFTPTILEQMESCQRNQIPEFLQLPLAQLFYPAENDAPLITRPSWQISCTLGPVNRRP